MGLVMEFDAPFFIGIAMIVLACGSLLIALELVLSGGYDTTTKNHEEGDSQWQN